MPKGRGGSKKPYVAAKIVSKMEKRGKGLKAAKKSGGMFDFIYKRRKAKEKALKGLGY